MKKFNDIYMGKDIRISGYQGIREMKYILILIMLLVACTAVFADGSLSDPMSVGVGARALGMGKAYAGVAEDGDAVFMNPAGLARITNPKLSSMYTSRLGKQ